MEEDLIRKFLLDKKSYLKCGAQRIQDAICAKHNVVVTFGAIKKVRKEIKKSLKVAPSKKKSSLVEDFANQITALQKQLEFVSKNEAPKLVRKKHVFTIPALNHQEGMHILLGCNHVPFHNKQLHRGIRELISDHKDKVVGFHLMGDFMDMNTLSSHDKGKFTAVPGLTLRDEYAEGNNELDEFDAVLPAGTWKTYLYGNHEDRWNRWMSSMENAKTPLDSPEEALELMKRNYHFKTSWKDDYFTIGRDFEIFHGIYFSIHCAKAHLDKLKTSCGFVHTHRQQIYREGKMAAFNLGSCADFYSAAFNYATRPMKAQWANGFGINMVDSRGTSHVELINAGQDGHFYFGGKLY